MFHKFVLEMLLVYRSVQFTYFLVSNLPVQKIGRLRFHFFQNGGESRYSGSPKTSKKPFTITTNRFQRFNYGTNLSA